MRAILSTTIFLALTLATTGCGDSQSPEAQVRAVIDAMETAAEARDAGELLEHVSEEYRDALGQGRAEAARYLRGFLLANQNVHLLTRIESLDFPSTREARADVLVGMVSREDADAAAWDLAADLYEFEVSFVREDGEWKATYAEWKRR